MDVAVAAGADDAVVVDVLEARHGHVHWRRGELPLLLDLRAGRVEEEDQAALRADDEHGDGIVLVIVLFQHFHARHHGFALEWSVHLLMHELLRDGLLLDREQVLGGGRQPHTGIPRGGELGLRLFDVRRSVAQG